ncbi:MAG: hypothetical protein GY943_12020, partial [Chloroflexi bacterium]|nr:hypothetical protein [Chloroflexota bacterium]
MNQKRVTTWIGALLALILLVAGLLWVDPFGWRLFDRLQGEQDVAITAMPPETA